MWRGYPAKKLTWFTKGLRPGQRLKFNHNALKETDLIYEGIATCVLSYPAVCVKETDLIYEGIATYRYPHRINVTIWTKETDLIYEGIATDFLLTIGYL